MQENNTAAYSLSAITGVPPRHVCFKNRMDRDSQQHITAFNALALFMRNGDISRLNYEIMYAHHKRVGKLYS